MGAHAARVEVRPQLDVQGDTLTRTVHLARRVSSGTPTPTPALEPAHDGALTGDQRAWPPAAVTETWIGTRSRREAACR
jgi:hypothetical protein